jgi:acetylornithine deacetylase/succinyl-diaminopimelate desuccinylase-like protein
VDLTTVRRRAERALPGLIEELSSLVAIPSVALPGYPADPVHRAADAVVGLFHRSGVPQARLLDVPGGYPAVFADIPGPEGAPTVLLYAHYDVQPAVRAQGWSRDPWTAVRGDDGRIYGRGTADDKGGEEAAGHLEDLVAADPGLFAADMFVLTDMGNPAVGEPALTTALRGTANCVVTVRTLEQPVHSGLFGGAAPDALVALIRILATLHDERGGTAVPGLYGSEWTGGAVDPAVFRRSAGVLDGVDLVGEGSLASRLWSRPSVTVIGLDAPPVAGASTILIPQASAHLSLRIPPGADADHELAVVMDHLRRVAPWNVRVEVTEVMAAESVRVGTDTPGMAAARAALTEAFGRPAGEIGCGGSIPLVAALSRAWPRADVVLWGVQDMVRARIHGCDESVDPAELERMVVAQARLLSVLGGRG